MSASEKLKALLHKAKTDEFSWDNDIHGEPLLMALPQLVAAVEAAESPNALRGDLNRALAALDEALGSA